MKIPVSIVVAVDDKKGIGKHNDLLFKIPDDLKRFRQLTKGHAIIMGWKTFKSIGRELPDRLNIILTREASKEKELEGYRNSVIYHDIQLALERAKKYELDEQNETPEVFIIGGGQIFKIALEENLVDRIYLTKVKGDYGADTFFPEYKKFTKIIEEENKESVGYHYTNVTLEK